MVPWTVGKSPKNTVAIWHEGNCYGSIKEITSHIKHFRLGRFCNYLGWNFPFWLVVSGPRLEKSPPKWFSCLQQLGCRKTSCFSKLNCKWPWNLAEEWHLCHECFFCYPVTIQANLAKLKKHICSVDTYQKFTTVTSKKKSLSMFSSLTVSIAVQMMRCSS